MNRDLFKLTTLSILFSLLLSQQVFSQIGIGTNSPQAALDISSTNKGILIPRIALTATNQATILTPKVSEMVYNTTTSVTGINQVTPGFYYWNGTLWVRVLDSDNKTYANTFSQFSERPTTLTAADAGKMYLYTQTSNIHRWDGTAWKVLDTDGVINVLDYGVIADAVTNASTGVSTGTDDYAAIQAILVANINQGGKILSFPTGKRILISQAIKITGSDITIKGNGCWLVMPETGWNNQTAYLSFGFGSNVNAALMTIFGTTTSKAKNIIIENLNFRRTKEQDLNKSPKAILASNAQDVIIAKCRFERSAFETIWANGNPGNTNSCFNFIIKDNTFDDCSNLAGAFLALPVIQCNFTGASITGNTIRNSGIGIGGSGQNLMIENNTVIDCVSGIAIGDSYCKNIIIANNTILIGKTPTQLGLPTYTAPLNGLYCAGSFNGDNLNNQFINNNIEISAPFQTYGIFAGKDNATFSGNSIRITNTSVNAIGIFVQAQIIPKTTILADNKVLCETLDSRGIFCYDDAATKSITIQSSDNLVIMPSGTTLEAYGFSTARKVVSFTSKNDKKVNGFYRANNVPLPALPDTATFSCAYTKTNGYNNYNIGSEKQKGFALVVPATKAMDLCKVSFTDITGDGAGTGSFFVTLSYNSSPNGFRNKTYLVSTSASELQNSAGVPRTWKLQPFQDESVDDGIVLAVNNNGVGTGGQAKLILINNNATDVTITAGVTTLTPFQFITDLNHTPSTPPTLQGAFIGTTDKGHSVLNAQTYGNNIPTTGWYKKGHIIWNTQPVAGTGFVGWICTTTGNPGTWKTFGAISN
jgi:hypothetical protein